MPRISRGAAATRGRRYGGTSLREATRRRDVLPDAVANWLPSRMSTTVHEADGVLLTREQVALRVGLTRAELDSCERLEALGPSRPGVRSGFARAQYDAHDVAVASVVADGHRRGLRGRALTTLRQQVEGVIRALPAGFSGWLVLANDQAHAVPASAGPGQVADWVQATPPGTAVLISRVEVSGRSRSE